MTIEKFEFCSINQSLKCPFYRCRTLVAQNYPNPHHTQPKGKLPTAPINKDAPVSLDLVKKNMGSSCLKPMRQELLSPIGRLWCIYI